MCALSRHAYVNVKKKTTAGESCLWQKSFEFQLVSEVHQAAQLYCCSTSLLWAKCLGFPSMRKLPHQVSKMYKILVQKKKKKKEEEERKRENRIKRERETQKDRDSLLLSLWRSTCTTITTNVKL